MTENRFNFDRPYLSKGVKEPNFFSFLQNLDSQQ
jgi:hypothetical protein